MFPFLTAAPEWRRARVIPPLENCGLRHGLNLWGLLGEDDSQPKYSVRSAEQTAQTINLA